DGHRDLGLGQSKQGEAGLGLDSEVGGPAERLLGGVEVAEPSSDLADLSEAEGGIEHVHAVELRAGLARLLLGLGPLAPELEHLGPVDTAQAGKGAGGVRARPEGADLRPLAGAPEIAELFTGADEAAVDLAGDERPHSAL